MMSANSPYHRHVRSWYGLSVEIDVAHDFWHLVRAGRLALPHPPLINLILRRGQPRDERLHLSFLHEFGHVQTLPVPLAHIALLGLRGRWRGRGLRGLLCALLAALIAHQALWEMSSESYVMLSSGEEYGRIYRRSPNTIGQITFWSSMAALTLFFSRKVMHQ